MYKARTFESLIVISSKGRSKVTLSSSKGLRFSSRAISKKFGKCGYDFLVSSALVMPFNLFSLFWLWDWINVVSIKKSFLLSEFIGSFSSDFFG